MSSSTSITTRTAHPWRTAVLAGMASYLDAGAIVTTGIALVLYAATLGIDPGTLGLLSGLLTICFAIGAVIGGRLGDRFGRRRVFTLTLLVFIVGTALLTFAAMLPMLFVGVILVGLAIGADLPVSLALIAEEAPEGKKGSMIVFSGMLWMMGILVTIVLSIFVAPLGELGGRILFGQLLLVAVVVVIARRGLRESAEWEAKTGQISLRDTADEERITFSALRQVFAAPVVFALIATGLYYSIWNIGANSFGQFGTFFFVNLAGADVQTASMLNLVTFPLGLIGAFIFMRVVDKPARGVFFVIGTIANVVAFALPLVLGFSTLSFTLLLLFFGLGTAFCGEAMYKVWSQELFPTLLRSSAQGITLALARVIAGIVAFGTPALASGNPSALFGLLAGCALVSGLIGLFWVPRLPKAAQIEKA